MGKQKNTLMKKFLYVILALFAVYLVLALFGPKEVKVERSVSINKPSTLVTAKLADYKYFHDEWSPFTELDPNMKSTYKGNPGEVGHQYAWEGNKEVGSGRMEIMESKPASKVSVKLHFLKPFEAQNTAEFTLTPKGEQTEVVWAMFGPQPFMAKLMGLFFSMEKMVGPDFEQGLASLKAVVERPN